MEGQASSRSAILVGIIAIGCALAGVAVSCAKGSETQLEVPEGDSDVVGPDGTTIDTGGDTMRPDTGGDTRPGDTKPIFDSELFCGDLGVPNTCDKVIDVGTVPIAGTRKVFGNIPIDGGDVWYKVTFDGLDDLTAHPRVRLVAAEAGVPFLFEVIKSCAKEAFSCGDDASPAKLTEFEQQYADADPISDAPDAFMPITLGAGGTTYIRVFRNGTAKDCTGFVINITN